MAAIADSTAYQDPERILTQHQAALTLLQARLSTPECDKLCWLDVACGRGQIIVSLEENLSLDARSRVEFWGFDANQMYAVETRRIAERLSFARVETRIGDLADLDRILPSGGLFDFITLTNTVHEVRPDRLASLLVSCIRRLAWNGTLFIYDMEQISPPELGAVPWNKDDVRRIVVRLLRTLGSPAYLPEVGRWSHKSCNGWNVQLQRQHMGVSEADVTSKSDNAVRSTSDEIISILRRRMDECRRSLESLTIYGASTSQEHSEKERLLFEFWAIARALECAA